MIISIKRGKRQDMDRLIKRLIKVGPGVAFHAWRGYVHVSSDFSPVLVEKRGTFSGLNLGEDAHKAFLGLRF